MFFDPMYLLFVMLPGMAISMWASFKTKSAFNKYAKVRAASGMTGAQAARRMLDIAGLQDVKILRSHGFLSDHYNPINRTLNLSQQVYDLPSLASRRDMRFSTPKITSRFGCGRFWCPRRTSARR